MLFRFPQTLKPLIYFSIIYLLLKIKILFSRFWKPENLFYILTKPLKILFIFFQITVYHLRREASKANRNPWESLLLLGFKYKHNGKRKSFTHTGTVHSLQIPGDKIGRYPNTKKSEKHHIVHKLFRIAAAQASLLHDSGDSKEEADSVIIIPYSSILRGSHLGQVYTETAGPGAWHTSGFTLISPWDNHLLSSQQDPLFLDISILPAILSPLILMSVLFLSAWLESHYSLQKQTVPLLQGTEDLLVQGR